MRNLKSEFDITTHLLDESKRFSELLPSQWRELASGGTLASGVKQKGKIAMINSFFGLADGRWITFRHGDCRA